MPTETDLAIVEAPLPAYSGEGMMVAFKEYRKVQQALDEVMADAIIKVGTRYFRKKEYWKALGVAYNVTLELVHEHRDVHNHFDDGRDNFTWYVTVRATAPNGRCVIGDGSCSAVEKAPKGADSAERWKTQPAQATEHNIRSHAWTRASNRATSNLFGFGEVSFEEVEAEFDPVALERERSAQPPEDRPAPTRQAAPKDDDNAVISERQAKRYYAIAKQHGWSDQELRAWLSDRWGYDSDRKIKAKEYDRIVGELSASAPR